MYTTSAALVKGHHDTGTNVVLVLFVGCIALFEAKKGANEEGERISFSNIFFFIRLCIKDLKECT